MDFAEKLFDDMARQGIQRGHSPVTGFSIKHSTGRSFNYDLSGFRITPDLSLVGMEALARQILAVKYVNCPWDKKHPDYPSAEYILNALFKEIHGCVMRMQRVRAEDVGDEAAAARVTNAPSPPHLELSRGVVVDTSSAPPRDHDWVVRRGSEVIKVFPHDQRRSAASLLSVLSVNEPNRYRLEKRYKQIAGGDSRAEQSPA